MLAPTTLLILVRSVGTASAQPHHMRIPYRDVAPPQHHEAPSSVWLSHLPPLDPGNKNLQWCEHYTEPVPPIWDTGHAGVELKGLVSGPEYAALAVGRRERALVMACGTGSDAIMLLEHGFRTVACVEICSIAILQAIGKLWHRLAERRANANIFMVRGDGQVDRWDAPNLPKPSKSDPRIEFYEQDNLALEYLFDSERPGTQPAAADLIYDNSAYNNLRNPQASLGALQRYLSIVSRLLSPGAMPYARARACCLAVSPACCQ